MLHICEAKGCLRPAEVDMQINVTENGVKREELERKELCMKHCAVLMDKMISKNGNVEVVKK